ncbi:DUF6480 family protein [Streptomyces clavifer]|uniref:DUF6480 family protein n=1 Tax=Streptomyces clavifer TaxID=68188 RepID=UPI0037AE822B
MTYENQDPDPGEVSGLDLMEASVPGTPAGRMPEAGPPYHPPRGWGKGPLVAVPVIVALVAAFSLVYALLV